MKYKTRDNKTRGMQLTEIKAPFTPEQVLNIQDYQNRSGCLAFCCEETGESCEVKRKEGEGILQVCKEGLVCPCGKEKQDFAFDFMARS